MKVKFIRIGWPLYCDIGPNAGDMLIDLTVRLYLSPEEYARYAGPESLQVSLNDNSNGCLPAGTKAPDAGGLS